MDRADRVRGLVLGCALGDAVGLCTEFMTATEAAAAYGELLKAREGSKTPWLQPGDAVRDGHRSKWVKGDWTDDTDQVILILRCMLPDGALELRAPDPLSFARGLMDWHRHGFPELGDTNGCGMGRSTARVLDEANFLQAPNLAAKQAWDLTGRCVAPNGALMRAPATGIRGKQHAAADAKAIAEVTHADPRSTAASIAVAQLVAGLLEAEGIDSLLAAACAVAEQHLPDEAALGPLPAQLWACGDCTLENAPTAEICAVCGAARPAAGCGTVNAGFGDSWSEAAAEARSYRRQAAVAELRAAFSGQAPAEEGIGYVNTCLAAAMSVFRAWAQRSPSPDAFMEAIHGLAMAGGDADTNGAVAGALLGCAWGASALPETWLQQMPHRAWLEQIASRVAKAKP